MKDFNIEYVIERQKTNSECIEMDNYTV